MKFSDNMGSQIIFMNIKKYKITHRLSGKAFRNMNGAFTKVADNLKSTKRIIVSEQLSNPFRETPGQTVFTEIYGNFILKKHYCDVINNS